MTERRLIDPEDHRLTHWERHVLRTIALRLHGVHTKADAETWEKIRAGVRGPRATPSEAATAPLVPEASG